MRSLIGIDNILRNLNKLDFLGLCFLRVYLCFIFWTSGSMKLASIDKFSGWLAKLNIPFAEIVSWIVVSCEIGGAFFLFIGLFVRWVSIPLLVIMASAILLVHMDNGWSHEVNGIEFAVTYSLMLCMLLFLGGGRYLSLDYWVSLKT
mgnify:CR=1 FL=1